MGPALLADAAPSLGQSVHMTRCVLGLAVRIWSIIPAIPVQEIKKSKITLLRDEITALRNRVHELESDASSRVNDFPNEHQLAPAAVPTSTWAVSPTLSDNSALSRYPSQLRDASPPIKPLANGEQYQQQFPLADPAYHHYLSTVPAVEGFQAPPVYVSGLKFPWMFGLILLIECVRVERGCIVEQWYSGAEPA
jgi:hypothetical protein